MTREQFFELVADQPPGLKFAAFRQAWLATSADVVFVLAEGTGEAHVCEAAGGAIGERLRAS